MKTLEEKAQEINNKLIEMLQDLIKDVDINLNNYSHIRSLEHIATFIKLEDSPIRKEVKKQMIEKSPFKFGESYKKITLIKNTGKIKEEYFKCSYNSSVHQEPSYEDKKNQIILDIDYFYNCDLEKYYYCYTLADRRNTHYNCYEGQINFIYLYLNENGNYEGLENNKIKITYEKI